MEPWEYEIERDMLMIQWTIGKISDKQHYDMLYELWEKFYPEDERMLDVVKEMIKRNLDI